MDENIIPWGKIETGDAVLQLKLPRNQSLEIRKIKNELLIIRNTDVQPCKNRFITGDGQNIYIEPGLPPLPIILKPVQKISILPSKKLEVFIEVPFVIRLFYGSKQNKNFLCEVELDPLSRSFFGNSENGEFAYYMETSMHSSISDYTEKNYSVYCPVTISNKSSQSLEFEKMILRAPYLSVYKDGDTLIASPVIITFSGQEQISQITYKKTPPLSGNETVLLSPPRSEKDKNILKRSFYFIKNLYTG